VVELRVANVYLGLGSGGTDLVSVTGGTGVLTMDAVAMSGSFAGTVAVNVPGVTFTGAFTVDIRMERAVGGQRFVRVSGISP
jgi:hypothetical protein